MTLTPRILALIAVSGAFLQCSAVAHTPVDFLEVVEVEPARTIEHGVELRSKLDQSKVNTALEGPVFFAKSVGCMGRKVKDTPAYLNWYKIVSPTTEPTRTLTILDMIRGSDGKQLNVRSAEYFLSPSQLISSGAPDAIPDGLDHYKAYRVVDAPSASRQVTLSTSLRDGPRQIGKPLFVCVPAAEWHHHEHFAASHPNDCFVVYELDEQDHDQTFTTIDQFGLNELRIIKNRWLCVRAALLGVKSE